MNSTRKSRGTVGSEARTTTETRVDERRRQANQRRPVRHTMLRSPMNLMGGMHDDGKRVELRLNSSSCERNTKARERRPAAGDRKSVV